MGMTNILLGLAAFAMLAASPSATSTQGTHVKTSTAATLHKAPGGGVHVPPGKAVTYLSAQECTTLGGTVSDATICNGTGKKCTVVIHNPATVSGEKRELCLTQ